MVLLPGKGTVPPPDNKTGLLLYHRAVQPFYNEAGAETISPGKAAVHDV